MFKQSQQRAYYEPHLRDKILVISPMTVAELERWAIARNWGSARRHHMEQHLRQYVVEPFSKTLCQKWAEATHSSSESGFSISCADAWVAAVALLHDLALITNNWKHFHHVEKLRIISETAPGA